jgi:trehalose-6-phosphate synthase
MPLEERRQRQAANFKVLAENDLTHWAERFLQDEKARSTLWISPNRVQTHTDVIQ